MGNHDQRKKELLKFLQAGRLGIFHRSAPGGLVWGFVIVADSAQFSASITELAEPAYLGTALTMQTCVGFLLTMGSIRLIPVFADWFGWPWVFAPLAVGPVLGALSMYRLRQLPEAARILGGTQKLSIEERKSHGSTPPV